MKRNVNDHNFIFLSAPFMAIAAAVLIASAAVWALAWLAGSETAYAAGTYSVSGEFPRGAELGGEVTYRIYRVGHLSGSVIDFEPKYSQAGSSIDISDAEGISERGSSRWREEWMSSAETLSHYVQADDLCGTCRSTDGRFAFTGLESGLYLVTGTSQSAAAGSGRTIYLWPRPMYVIVADRNAVCGLKPGTGATQRITVKKVWEGDEEVRDLVRPEKITIHRAYKGKDMGDIVLPKDGEWFYSWETGEAESDPSGWTISEDFDDNEELRKNYAVEISGIVSDADSQTVTVTNRYSRYSLEITKKMKEFIARGSGSLQTFVFEVSGYDADGKRIYHRLKGIVFGDLSAFSKKAVIRDIPRTAEKITVRETYSGNYAPVGASVQTFTEIPEDGVLKAEFTNAVDTSDPTYDTGIINRYSITGNGAFSFLGTGN